MSDLIQNKEKLEPEEFRRFFAKEGKQFSSEYKISRATYISDSELIQKWDTFAAKLDIALEAQSKLKTQKIKLPKDFTQLADKAYKEAYKASRNLELLSPDGTSGGVAALKEWRASYDWHYKGGFEREEAYRNDFKKFFDKEAKQFYDTYSKVEKPAQVSYNKHEWDEFARILDYRLSKSVQ